MSSLNISEGWLDSKAPGLAVASNLFTPDQVVSPYTTWKIVTRYSNRSGIIQVPVANVDGTAAELVKVSANRMVQLVTWTATRQGAMPYLVGPVTNDPNRTLSDWDLIPHSTDLMSDGTTHVYTVEGWYLYLLTQPITIQSGQFFMGGSPVDLTTASMNVIGPAQFLATLSP
jgi:hypothetical protein